MKKYLLILTLVFAACKTIQKDSKQIYTDYKVVNIQILTETKTLTFNELRFYDIKSAMDAMKLMYKTYGKWDKSIEGKHQPNINKLIWENVKLFENDQETFTVIADGTETKNEYFACLIVLDSKGKDCFEENNLYRDKLVNLFLSQMIKTKPQSVDYNKFRK